MCALKKGTEIATIDVELVTIKYGETGSETEIGIKTSSKVAVVPKVNTVDAVELVVKGVLYAQKPEEKTLVGNTITLTDNVFTPEVVVAIQGGTITYDAVDTDKVTGYTPPVVGSTGGGETFELCLYSAQYDASGAVTQYEKIAYPNCSGSPIAPGGEDGVFRIMEYSIFSAAKNGQAPYAITYVAALPALT